MFSCHESSLKLKSLWQWYFSSFYAIFQRFRESGRGNYVRCLVSWLSGLHWSTSFVLGCAPSLNNPFLTCLHHCHGLILAPCIAWMAWKGKVCCFFLSLLCSHGKKHKRSSICLSTALRDKCWAQKVGLLRAVARMPAKTCYSLFKLPYVSGAFADNVVLWPL